ncbi:hypothetical protein PHYPSEUDO_005745 [Phytophthora pseudosyringae]|uniref:Uncharacterized protein n=1 Tax=Phytophthora pseudosyringae TaxID=221518 RepID=A0A8T1VNC7_9STRA|nr:hypothetical protein PHYPSEUDO_005745 [Phytophthora pseudosyringae]
MMLTRLLDGYDDAPASQEGESAQSEALVSASVVANSTSTEPPSGFVSRPPVSYTSHAMMLQLQEYRDRVRSAIQSTYHHPLAVAVPPSGPGSPRKRDAHSGNYCRARVLESSRQIFAREARSGAPIAPVAASSPPRTMIKGGGVAFHRTATSSRAAVKSNLFALGPGQYDVVPRRPATTGSVKFSPADRFREHAGGGSRDPHAPGPGQYLPDDRVVAKRSARVVFSQLPRQTETAAPPRGSTALPPATTDVVSSYYYIPDSGFVSPGDSVSKTGGGIPNWSRSARFPGRRREHFRHPSTQVAPAVDYISRNKAQIESMSTVQRQRRCMEQAAAKTQQKTKPTEPGDQRKSSVRRRNSLFCTCLGGSGLAGVTSRRRSSAGSVQGEGDGPETQETVSQAWGTLVVLSVAQTKLVRLLTVAAVLNRLRRAQESRYKRITFESWTHVRDRDAMRSFAAVLIVGSTFHFRLSLRVERKIRAASLLRSFLSGLSVDVRFAMAVRRVQRRITVLQRWWRRARLVVRAREQCLANKWLAVEQRLRAEAIAQMPHLQRVFQPPPIAAVPITPPGSFNALTKRRASKSSTAPQSVAVEAQLPLHKLLNLPEQQRWFNARFVLNPDGVLRGYAIPERETKGAGATAEDSATRERLVVEVKHFRCHAHGFPKVSLGSPYGTGVEDEGESDTRPYLMVFRPGASRFVLITDTTSLILAPLLDWKEKLECLTGYPVGSAYPGGESQRDIADMLAQTDSSVLDDPSDEPVVQTPSARRMSITGGGSVNSERSPSMVQGRKRSSRHRLRRSTVLQPVAEGEMAYYVVDLLRDCPRIPGPIVWSVLRDKLREERKNFRAEIYRFKLESTRYQQHERERRQLVVLDKFKEFFTMERPRPPHFRSLISHRKMEALVLQTIEFVKTSQPSNPKFMLPS